MIALEPTSASSGVVPRKSHNLSSAIKDPKLDSVVCVQIEIAPDAGVIEMFADCDLDGEVERW
jgi:hypothetical protein